MGHLQIVLSRFQKHGIHLKHEKCNFFQSSVEYLGHLSMSIHLSRRFKLFWTHLHHVTFTSYVPFLDF
jgi:hypothetical protein